MHQETNHLATGSIVDHRASQGTRIAGGDQPFAFFRIISLARRSRDFERATEPHVDQPLLAADLGRHLGLLDMLRLEQPGLSTHVVPQVPE